MSTVVLRLAAPLSAWGADSKYRSRTTRPDPSYSAIVGLLAAAAGVRRGDPLPPWLREVEFAIRVDAPGTVLRDFHTINPPDFTRYSWLSSADQRKVRTVVSADGATRNDPVVTSRFYRQDAVYLVFIADPTGEVMAALQAPKFALYAGRKSCTLTFPIIAGVSTLPIEEAVIAWPRERSGGAVLEACMFTEPQGHPVIREEDLFDRPAASGFAKGRRYYFHVDPPNAAEVTV